MKMNKIEPNKLKQKMLVSKIKNNFLYLEYIKSIISLNDEPTKENIEILKQLLLNDLEIKEEIRWRNILFIIGHTNVIFTHLKMYTYSFDDLHFVDLRAHEESINYEYDDDHEEKE